jgi:hypothetical protein
MSYNLGHHTYILIVLIKIWDNYNCLFLSIVI